MQAGKFDTRVTFQEKVSVPDGGGGYTVEWQEMQGAGQGKRWAAVWAKPQNTADEETSTARVSNAPDYTLIVRTDSGTRTIKSNWRVLIDGLPYAIKSLTRPDRVRGTITMIVKEDQPT